MGKTPKSDLPYRPCVGIMLLNTQNQVWVGRRIDRDPAMRDAWQMPQGGIDKGETPAEAALRELEEEIGTAKATILAEAPDWFSYDLPDHMIGKVWKGKYRGQTQRWFAARFTGQDSDIDIETEHPEFDAWRWVPSKDLPDLIVPFKRQTYTDVLAAFSNILEQ